MKNPIWLYWESLNNKPEPAYITLCRWTMLHHWGEHNLIFLNSANIEHYLPGINRRIGQIEVDVVGRFDLLQRKLKFKANNLNLAVKCDVYRANLLNEYGGIYVDSSAIALQPLTKYFDEIEQGKPFFISQRQSFNRNHYPVSFYGSRPKGSIINAYCKVINRLVQSKTNFHYNEIGASALTPIVNKMLDEALIVNEKEVMPITFESADQDYINLQISPKDLVNDSACIFKLFNNPFKTKLAHLNVEELYNSEYLIGKLFRYALPQNKFEYYNNLYS